MINEQNSPAVAGQVERQVSGPPCHECKWWQGKCFRNNRDFNKCVWSKDKSYPLFIAR